MPITVVVKGTELYDEINEQFVTCKDTVLHLEHSLISIAKWESKWHRPFLDNKNLTTEEMYDYVRCMTISQNEPDRNVYYCLSRENVKEIRDYMEDTMTATWFNDKNNPKSRQKTVTAELIYYWMIKLGIPFSCAKWHINRLLTLIRVCNIEDTPKKKMRKNEIFKQNKALNDARRRMANTSG